MTAQTMTARPVTTLDLTTGELLEDLQRRGIEIGLDGDGLSVRAPRGVITGADRSTLAARRDALLAHLRKQQGEPAERSNATDFPLTDVQQAYWVGRRSIALGNIGCHAYREFVTDEIDLPRLETAWQQLIARHGMLRAVISADGRQRILENVAPYRIATLDLRGAPDAAAQLAALRERLSHHTFDPASWPMFDIRATYCDDGIHLHIGMDLLIADAHSMLLLYREWAALYREPGLALPPLKRRFEDFVRRGRSTPEALARSAAYWSERLPGLPGAPELPLVIPEQPLAEAGAPTASPRFTRHTRPLPPAVWAALSERARAAGLTPSNVLAAAYADILAKWSRHQHFLITLTTFDVPAEFAGVVGDFTSTLLLEIDARAPRFIDRARALQARLANDLDHTGWSGVRVMRELARLHQRLVDSIPVVFTSALGHRKAGENDGNNHADSALPLAWLGRTVHAITQTPQVWIDHHVIEDGDSLLVTWDVADGIFPAGMIEEMFAAHGDFLRALASDDEAWSAPLGRHLPARQAETRRLANTTNTTNATTSPLPDGFLQDGFFAWATREPQRPALITPEVSLSYGELAAQACAVAQALRRAGAARNQLVGVAIAKGAGQIAAVLGILAAGAAYLPIDPALPPARQRQLAELGEIRLLLVPSTKQESAVDWPEGVQTLALDSLAPDSSGALPPPLPGSSAGDLAYVLFTSGSTGQPKGVMIEHRAALNTIVDINRRFAIGANDAVLGISSLSFDLSVYDIFGLLGCGGRLVLPGVERRRDPAHWLRLMRENGITVWNSVPALLTMLVDHGAPVGDALRVVMLSGDWIPLGLPARIKALAPQVTVYGLGGATEASIWSNYFEVRRIEPHWRSIPYGWPLANQAYHVLDDVGEPAPEGVPGRLHIAGSGLARGYWNDAPRTAERFYLHAGLQERLYDTGDIARYLPDGAIEFLGREDAQVKVQGYRIELGEIEARLRAHPAVSEALVLAVGESASERRLLAWIIPQDTAASTPKANASPDGVLADAGQRTAWKLGRHGIRPVSGGAPRIALPAAVDNGRVWERRSTRHFAASPITPEVFSEFLAALRSHATPTGVGRKYHYPSAGSSYSVQTWLHLKEGGVTGISGGFYYYHPERHDLELVDAGETTGLSAAQLHFGAENRAAFDSCAVSIFLVAHLEAITPLYGEHARELCLLEAGYIGQLLAEQAVDLGLGICAIGALNDAPLAKPLDLGARRQLIHSFLLGWPAPCVHSAPPQKQKQEATVSLATWCAETLPDYMVPAAFINIDALPLTANGKVDRSRLPQPSPQPSSQPSSEHDASHTAQRAPDGPLEQGVAAIFAEVLGTPSVGRDDVVFDLGGTSVHVVRIHRRLEEKLRTPIDIVDVFRFPSVRQLAAHLQAQIDPLHDPQQPPASSAATGMARGQSRRNAASRRRSGAGGNTESSSESSSGSEDA